MAIISQINTSGSTYTLAIPYGTCSVAVGTAAKTATVSGVTLNEGTQVRVKFTNGNSAATPTLNINSTGAKSIVTTNAGGGESIAWAAGAVIDFTYNGTAWVMDNVGAFKASTTTVSDSALSVSPSVTPTATASATSSNVSLTASTAGYSGFKISVTGGNSSTTGSATSGESSTVTTTEGYTAGNTKTITSSGIATANASSKTVHYSMPTSDHNITIGTLGQSGNSGGDLSGGGLSGGGLGTSGTVTPVVDIYETAEASQDQNVGVANVDVGDKDTANYPYYFKVTADTTATTAYASRAGVTRGKIDRSKFTNTVTRATTTCTSTAGYTSGGTKYVGTESSTVQLAAGSMAATVGLAAATTSISVAKGTKTEYVKLKKGAIGASAVKTQDGSATVTTNMTTVTSSSYTIGLSTGVGKAVARATATGTGWITSGVENASNGPVDISVSRNTTTIYIKEGTCAHSGNGLSKGTASGGGLEGGTLSRSTSTVTPTIDIYEVDSSAQDANVTLTSVDIGAKDTTNYPYYFKVGANSSASTVYASRAKVKRNAFSQAVTRATLTCTHTEGYIPAGSHYMNSTSSTVELAADDGATISAATTSIGIASGSTTEYVKLKKGGLGAGVSVTDGGVTVATSMSVSATSTAYNITLTPSNGSATGSASVATEGYVKNETASSGAKTVTVAPNTTTIYITKAVNSGEVSTHTVTNPSVAVVKTANGFTASSASTAYYVSVTQGVVTPGKSTATAKGNITTAGYAPTGKSAESAASEKDIGTSVTNLGSVFIPTTGVTASIATLSVPSVAVAGTASGFTASSATTAYYVKVTGTKTDGSVKGKAKGNGTGMITASTENTSAATAITPTITGNNGYVFIPEGNFGVNSPTINVGTVSVQTTPGNVSILKNTASVSGKTRIDVDPVTTPSSISTYYLAIRATAAANSTGSTKAISGTATTAATISTAGYLAANTNKTGTATVSGTAKATTSGKNSAVYYLPLDSGSASVSDQTVVPSALSGSWNSSSGKYVVSQTSKTATITGTGSAGYFGGSVGSGVLTISAPTSHQINRATISLSSSAAYTSSGTLTANQYINIAPGYNPTGTTYQAPSGGGGGWTSWTTLSGSQIELQMGYLYARIPSDMGANRSNDLFYAKVTTEDSARGWSLFYGGISNPDAASWATQNAWHYMTGWINSLSANSPAEIAFTGCFDGVSNGIQICTYIFGPSSVTQSDLNSSGVKKANIYPTNASGLGFILQLYEDSYGVHYRTKGIS